MRFCVKRLLSSPKFCSCLLLIFRLPGLTRSWIRLYAVGRSSLFCWRVTTPTLRRVLQVLARICMTFKRFYRVEDPGFSYGPWKETNNLTILVCRLVEWRTRRQCTTASVDTHTICSDASTKRGRRLHELKSVRMIFQRAKKTWPDFDAQCLIIRLTQLDII